MSITKQFVMYFIIYDYVVRKQYYKTLIIETILCPENRPNQIIGRPAGNFPVFPKSLKLTLIPHMWLVCNCV